MKARFMGYEVFTRKTYSRKYECMRCGEIFFKAIGANTAPKPLIDCQSCGCRTAERFIQPARSSEDEG